MVGHDERSCVPGAGPDPGRSFLSSWGFNREIGWTGDVVYNRTRESIALEIEEVAVMLL